MTGWTEERVERLKKLWSDGWSATQIAKDLRDITRMSVIGKARRLNLPSRKQGQRTGAHQPKPNAVKAGRLKAAQAAPARVRASMTRTYVLPEDRPLPARLVSATEAGAATARPWITRTYGECAFPVGGHGADTLSCCAPCGGETYCEAHGRVMYAAPKPGRPATANELARSLRRYVA